ncbi:MAG TPA: TetR/AcrR family transcriptional regulator [Gemmatimonadales bacterium]|nr:TetR/AcrR family transcriptional regulator [Gemmatimonadales bacterium]
MDTSPDEVQGGAELKPARQRLAPEERREAIMGAALSAFSDLGYTQATLNDVADRLGVTKGCLYHYFESKEKLLVELIRDRIGCPVAAEDLPPTGTREEVLRCLLQGIWNRLHQPGHIEVAILATTELPKVPEGGRLVFDEVVARSRQKLRQLLERGHPCSDITDEEIDRAARVIPLMIMGVALGSRVFRTIDPVQLSVEQVGNTVTNILMYGLLGTCPEAEG